MNTRRTRAAAFRSSAEPKPHLFEGGYARLVVKLLYRQPPESAVHLHSDLFIRRNDAE